MKTIKILVVILAAALVWSCEDDTVTPPQSDSNITDPQTDSTATVPQTDSVNFHHLELFCTDSVWICNRCWDAVIVCCVPIEEGKFFCYAHYGVDWEGVQTGTAGDLCFQDGYTYDYFYVDDGSDSLWLREHSSLSSYDLNHLKENPHFCITNITFPNGDTMTYRRAWTVEWLSENEFYTRRYPISLHTGADIDPRCIRNFRFRKIACKDPLKIFENM